VSATAKGRGRAEARGSEPANAVVEVGNATRFALDEVAIRRLVGAVLRAEGVHGAEMGVAFVGERRMRAMNRVHRHIDAVTDVLSFPLEEAGEADRAGAGAGRAGAGPPRLLGDVVVCPRRALRATRAEGRTLEDELAVLLVHGTLHLLGYDHDADRGEMDARQALLLGSLGSGALGA
jgi:probable rRNA maturation factor